MRNRGWKTVEVKGGRDVKIDREHKQAIGRNNIWRKDDILHLIFISSIVSVAFVRVIYFSSFFYFSIIHNIFFFKSLYIFISLSSEWGGGGSPCCSTYIVNQIRWFNQYDISVIQLSTSYLYFYPRFEFLTSQERMYVELDHISLFLTSSIPTKCTIMKPTLKLHVGLQCRVI